jgi:hypothetical protein
VLPGDLANANRCGVCVALSFESEVDGDGVRGWSKYVLANGIASAVTAGLRDIAAACGGRDEAPELDRAAFEVVLAPAEGLADLGEDRLPDGVRGQLLGSAADDRGGRGEKWGCICARRAKSAMPVGSRSCSRRGRRGRR